MKYIKEYKDFEENWDWEEFYQEENKEYNDDDLKNILLFISDNTSDIVDKIDKEYIDRGEDFPLDIYDKANVIAFQMAFDKYSSSLFDKKYNKNDIKNIYDYFTRNYRKVVDEFAENEELTDEEYHDLIYEETLRRAKKELSI